MGGRVAGEPHTEVGVGGVRVKLLADFFEGGHPRDGKVAVLEHDPRPVLLGTLDHLDGNRTLTLAERESAQLGSSKSL